MEISVYLLNSFAKTAGDGNPAGVVLNEDTLSGADMQRIAGLIGFSETVFL
jgi:PhzF family phenazine biosynthesis protein